MKISKIIVATSLLLTSGLATAHTSIINTSADGYISRGVEMFEGENYLGCIDQLSHALAIDSKCKDAEDATLYIALSEYNLGNSICHQMLQDFIATYPNSLNSSVAQFYLGNYYFFNGKYGEASICYSKANGKSLTYDERTDMYFRQGYSLLRVDEVEKAKGYLLRIAKVPRYRDASIFYQAYIDYTNKDYPAAVEKFDKVSANSPLKLDSRYYTTQIYFNDKDYSKAITYGNSMLERKTDVEHKFFDAEMQRIVGESQYQLGNDALAISNLEKYINSDDTTDKLRSSNYILGVLNYRRYDYQAAIDNMAEVTKDIEDQLTQSAYLFIGQSYLKLDKLNNASIAFEKAFKMPYSKQAQEIAFYNYAIAQQSGGRTPFNNAIEIFEQFHTNYPDSKFNADIDEYLANIYINEKDYSAALNSISKIKNPSSNVLKAKQYILYKLAIQNVANKDNARAEELFFEAKELAKQNPTLANATNIWIADIAYADKDYERAQRFYNEYVYGDGALDSNRSIGLYNMGYAQFQQKFYSDASKSFINALKSNVKLSDDLTADANNRIGDCYYYNEDYATAHQYYAKAITNSRVGDYAMYQAAITDGLLKKNVNKAKELETLINRFPDSQLIPSALTEQANAYIAINKPIDAMTSLRKVIEQYPNSVEARKAMLQLAISARNVGNESEAIKVYKDVITKYPSSEEAAVAIEDLKIIYADNNNIAELTTFLNSVPNAPSISVTEVDKLTFLAAEKSYIDNPNDITKLVSYIENFKDGAFIANAEYYIAKSHYTNKEYDEALKHIDTVLSLAKDASFAEDALAMKCEILTQSGDTKDLLNLYKELAVKATTNDNRIVANLGVMRSAKIMGYNQEVVDSSTKLLSLAGLTPQEEQEARLNRALSYLSLNMSNEAVEDLTILATETQSIYGVKAAYNLAEINYKSGDYDAAEKTLNGVIDNGTPHQYWLARCFILLSDIYMSEGKNFEAKEYLESLKSNYPGSETEIFSMIEERLTAINQQ